MADNVSIPDSDPAEADYQARLAFESPAEEVFAALTTTDGLGGWWTAVTGHGLAGGDLRFVFNEDDPPLIAHVDEARSASLVQWTCVAYRLLPDWAGTTITFALTPRPAGGCDLAFRHRGLTPRLECYDDCRNGWDHFLPSLKAYVDTGTGNPWASEADLRRREARRLRLESSTR